MPEPTPAPATAPAARAMTGPIGRARLALDAVETLYRLEEQERSPTPEELQTLGNWRGWGPLAPALETDRTGTWAALGTRIEQLLPRNEYRQAEQATPTAYFTPDRIADACWKALTDLGFAGGRILEPGCGTGRFIDRAPDSVDGLWTGIERDPTTSKIAQYLHPDADIRTAALQDDVPPAHSADAVVGNVPYGNFPVRDITAPDTVTGSIHNYFVWRSLKSLRPGGIAVLLTSRYTLDAVGDEALRSRREIAKLGELVGAVRLPNGALSDGGTEALADILVLRRRDGDPPEDEESWIDVARLDSVPGEVINTHFAEHPERVLGSFARGDAPRYGRTLNVDPHPDQDLTAALNEVFATISREAHEQGRTWNVSSGAEPFTEENLPFPVREDGRKEGSFHLVDGAPHEVSDGEMVPVSRPGKELPKLIRLRDATLALLDAETDHDRPDTELEPLRADLNRLYDAYAAAHGPLNRYTLSEGAVDPDTGMAVTNRRYPRLGGFRRDPDFVAVLALEDFDDDTQTAQKAALLHRRVNRRIDRPTTASSPEEALSMCLNAHNAVLPEAIADYLGIAEAEVPDALGDLVFTDPDGGTLHAASDYLTGHVVAKLDAARYAAARDDAFSRNVAALEAVQPTPLTPEQIHARLGAPWIPTQDVEDFITATLGRPAKVTHIPKTATWSVSSPRVVPEAATTEWGTSAVNGYQLIDLACNGQPPVVYDKVWDPVAGREKRERNDTETLYAEAKQTELNERFGAWVWEDPDRADRLADAYNRLFNSYVQPRSDGSHLTIDGIDSKFEPYTHQWDMVQRVLGSEEGSLCPYPVGAGKTATMFMTALKLKQLGIVSKPMIVVPNHLLEEISRDGKRVFPQANILMAGKKDLADARARMLFAARCATGDWDAVVMTQSSFTRLTVHPVAEAEYLESLSAEYREALAAAEGDGQSRRIKEIAKMVERFEVRAADLRGTDRDVGISFENLGIDFLEVDEAHYFKNLALPATTEGMNLGKPSKRSTDLDIKLNQIRQRTGRDNVTCMYTGTPISNSMREMYVFQHYLHPKRLEDLGMSPDGWAANFIRFESKPEVAADGVNFKLRRRPVEYTNADELLALFHEVAELRPREDFAIKRPQRAERTIAVEPSAALSGFVENISHRIDAIEGGLDPRVDNMLKVITDGRKAALDVELVGLEPDGPGKAEAIVENVAQVYQETRELRLPGDPEGEPPLGGFQLVFCDLGTPSKQKGSQVYGKMREGLVEAGIPRERIRFVHDYNTDLQKTQLFAACRAGEVSVLFASTDKAGVGTNVQTRGVALHHADPPHKPAEWEQREGRFDRPGNLSINAGRDVAFYRYIAEGSFDSFMYQQLERKQKPITQVMSGKRVGRVLQEIDPVGASFAEGKAIATGNPLLLELAEATTKLTQLHTRADGHRKAQNRMRRQVGTLSDEIAAHRQQADTLATLAQTVAAAPDEDAWRTTDGQTVRSEDVVDKLVSAVTSAGPSPRYERSYTRKGLQVAFSMQRRQVGRDINIVPHAHLKAGEAEWQVRIGLNWLSKGQGWRIPRAIDEAAETAQHTCEETRQQIATLEQRLSETNQQIGKPFEQQEELDRARRRKVELEAAIAGKASPLKVPGEPGGQDAEEAQAIPSHEPAEVRPKPVSEPETESAVPEEPPTTPAAEAVERPPKGATEPVRQQAPESPPAPAPEGESGRQQGPGEPGGEDAEEAQAIPSHEPAEVEPPPAPAPETGPKQPTPGITTSEPAAPPSEEPPAPPADTPAGPVTLEEVGRALASFLDPEVPWEEVTMGYRVRPVSPHRDWSGGGGIRVHAELLHNVLYKNGVPREGLTPEHVTTALAYSVMEPVPARHLLVRLGVLRRASNPEHARLATDYVPVSRVGAHVHAALQKSSELAAAEQKGEPVLLLDDPQIRHRAVAALVNLTLSRQDEQLRNMALTNSAENFTTGFPRWMEDPVSTAVEAQETPPEWADAYFEPGADDARQTVLRDVAAHIYTELQQADAPVEPPAPGSALDPANRQAVVEGFAALARERQDRKLLTAALSQDAERFSGSTFGKWVKDPLQQEEVRVVGRLPWAKAYRAAAEEDRTALVAEAARQVHAELREAQQGLFDEPEPAPPVEPLYPWTEETIVKRGRAALRREQKLKLRTPEAEIQESLGEAARTQWVQDNPYAVYEHRLRLALEAVEDDSAVRSMAERAATELRGTLEGIADEAASHYRELTEQCGGDAARLRQLYDDLRTPETQPDEYLHRTKTRALLAIDGLDRQARERSIGVRRPRHALEQTVGLSGSASSPDGVHPVLTAAVMPVEAEYLRAIEHLAVLTEDQRAVEEYAQARTQLAAHAQSVTENARQAPAAKSRAVPETAAPAPESKESAAPRRRASKTGAAEPPRHKTPPEGGQDMPTPTLPPVRAEEAKSTRQEAPAPQPPQAASAAAVERVNRLREQSRAQSPNLPLWAGQGMPTGRWDEREGVLYDAVSGGPVWRVRKQPAASGPEFEPSDPQPPLDGLADAWGEHVPPEAGTIEDLIAAMEEDLADLEGAWQQLAPREPETTTALESTEAQADAVNDALGRADQHTEVLAQTPEWEQIRTIRGAVRHLWDTVRERAGEYWENLRGDTRFDGFWRTVSIRACDAIARLATDGADRLRQSPSGELPSAQALLDLGGAALTYSAPGSRPSPETTGQEAERGMSRSEEPRPYATRNEATSAGREVSKAFLAWTESGMGQELAADSHPRTEAFRDAWRALPPQNLPDGPGSAAAPYGAVAETAQALLKAAETAGRFAAPDLAALRTVAASADQHSARLTATLPGTPQQTTPTTQAPSPVLPSPTRPAQSGPSVRA